MRSKDSTTVVSADRYTRKTCQGPGHAVVSRHLFRSLILDVSRLALRAIAAIGLLSTEGRVSIPLEDGTAAGVLDVCGSFFEFVDAQTGADDPSAIHRCQELIPGHEYRVLMTTSAGFYRYDIGDHTRVHGFAGHAPIVEFLHRGTHVSSVTDEKLTEWQVTAAFQRCSRELGLRITSFVLAPQWADPPFYRLYTDQPIDDPERLATLLDQQLSRMNIEYASKRSSGRLGPIVLSLLPRIDACPTRGGETSRLRLHRRAVQAPVPVFSPRG